MGRVAVSGVHLEEEDTLGDPTATGRPTDRPSVSMRVRVRVGFLAAERRRNFLEGEFGAPPTNVWPLTTRRTRTATEAAERGRQMIEGGREGASARAREPRAAT